MTPGGVTDGLGALYAPGFSGVWVVCGHRFHDSGSGAFILRPGFLEAEGPGKVGVQLLVNCFLRPGFLEAEGPGKVGVTASKLLSQAGFPRG